MKKVFRKLKFKISMVETILLIKANKFILFLTKRNFEKLKEIVMLKATGGYTMKRRIKCKVKNIIYKLGKFLFLHGIVMHHQLYGGMKDEINYTTISNAFGSEYKLNIGIAKYIPEEIDDKFLG